MVKIRDPRIERLRREIVQLQERIDSARPEDYRRPADYKRVRTLWENRMVRLMRELAKVQEEFKNLPL